MHLPVGPTRRASLGQFRLRRGLGAEDLAGYAAARLAALEAAAAEPDGGPAWRRWPSTPATRGTCWPAEAGSGRATTAAGPGPAGPTTSRRGPSAPWPSPPATRPSSTPA